MDRYIHCHVNAMLALWRCTQCHCHVIRAGSYTALGYHGAISLLTCPAMARPNGSHHRPSTTRSRRRSPSCRPWRSTIPAAAGDGSSRRAAGSRVPRPAAPAAARCLPGSAPRLPCSAAARGPHGGSRARRGLRVLLRPRRRVPQASRQRGPGISPAHGAPVPPSGSTRRRRRRSSRSPSKSSRCSTRTASPSARRWRPRRRRCCSTPPARHGSFSRVSALAAPCRSCRRRRGRRWPRC
uniref:Uncharacterized protein n=1 Tax=Oryza brachyantha TaxID=4533 RepID=J3MY27_ORYBR